MNKGQLLGVFIFGSVGRGDSDCSSDLDVLAIVENGSGRVRGDKVSAFLSDAQRGLEPEVSWYGRQRLAEMFRTGELFAWHLYQDALAVYDPERIIETLGPPAEYREASKDIRSFRKLLAGVPSSIDASPWNLTYEAGLVYICARNIAMSASAALSQRPDFSRNSPFGLAPYEPFPLKKIDYRKLMDCRLAGQRGGDIPRFSSTEEVMSMARLVQEWTDRVLVRVERQEENESRSEAIAF